MMNSPYIFRLESPVVVFNGRIFQAGKKITEKTEIITRTRDYIDIRNTRYTLEEIVTPAELETIQIEHEQEEFQEYQQRYIRETLQKTLLSKEFVEKQIAENKTLTFIINKVLPTITGTQIEQSIDSILTETGHEIRGSRSETRDLGLETRDSGHGTSNMKLETPVDRAIQKEIEKIRKTIEKTLEKEYKKYQGKEETPHPTLAKALEEIETTRYARLRDGSIFNDLLIPNYRIMIANNKIFRLLTAGEHLTSEKEHMSAQLNRKTATIPCTTEFEEIEELLKKNRDGIEKNYRSKIINKFRTTRINIAGINLIPIYAGQTRELIEPYIKLMEWQLKENALETNETQTQQMRAIAQEKQSLEDIAKKRKYEKNNAGFEIIDGEYYVFIKTPEYALKSPHDDNYYHFKSATIGVQIATYGTGFQIGPVRILNTYRHPFLQGDGSLQSLCVGQYHYESRERGMTPEEKILTRLSIGKQIIMEGYGTGTNPYRKLYEENFPRQKITEAEIKRKNLPVLNTLNKKERGVA